MSTDLNALLTDLQRTAEYDTNNKEYGKDYERRAKDVNQQATEFGRMRVREATRYILEMTDLSEEMREKRITRQWMSMLLDEDDTWSGRTNDVRRAYMDGVRDEIRNLRWTIA